MYYQQITRACCKERVKVRIDLSTVCKSAAEDFTKLRDSLLECGAVRSTVKLRQLAGHTQSYGRTGFMFHALQSAMGNSETARQLTTNYPNKMKNQSHEKNC
jgi:hypothetical protein